MAKYDVVVVGSGNAGMSAALYCILAGKKTLLIEKHNLPGGAASSFVRGRFIRMVVIKLWFMTPHHLVMVAFVIQDQNQYQVLIWQMQLLGLFSNKIRL